MLTWTLALRNYEGRITKYADQLDQKIAEANGQPVNVYNAVSYYTSDMMSDLAFGKAFGNLQSQSFHHSVQGVRDFMSVFGTLTPVPWFVRLGSGILRQFNGWKRFFKLTADQMNARIMVSLPACQSDQLANTESFSKNRLCQMSHPT